MPYDRGNMCFASVPKWGLYTPCGKSVLDQDRITVRSLKESVKQGDLVAMEKLAAYYMEGWGIGRPNYSKAGILLEAAREGRGFSSFVDLGWCYYYGHGVKKDRRKAFELYCRGASSGNSRGMYNVGLFYEDGKDVKKDLGMAFQWFMRAAKKGDGDAMFKVAYAYDMGRGVARNQEHAVLWYRKAARKGTPDAYWNLAIFYDKGIVVRRNPRYAEALRKRAGNMASSIRMILILGVMTVFTSFGDISPDMEGIADRLEKEGKILLMAVQDETSGLSVYAVDRARYDALPDWDSNAGTDPPVSIGEAIKVARKELVSSCGVEERCIELGTVHFESCTCWSSSHGKPEPVWCFAVIFSVEQNTKSISPGSSRARIKTVYVLLDGKVVKTAHMQHADSPDAKRGRTSWRWFWEGMKKGLH